MDEAREQAWRKVSPSGLLDGQGGIRSVERFAFELGFNAGVAWAQGRRDAPASDNDAGRGEG